MNKILVLIGCFGVCGLCNAKCTGNEEDPVLCVKSSYEAQQKRMETFYQEILEKTDSAEKKKLLVETQATWSKAAQLHCDLVSYGISGSPHIKWQCLEEQAFIRELELVSYQCSPMVDDCPSKTLTNLIQSF